MPLPSSDTAKLAKLLGMLGSAHDGEVINAARKAHELVRDSGATWCEVIGARDSERGDAAHQIQHHADALELLKSANMLTSFERKFLHGIMAFQKLTDKQEITLETIRAKVAVSKGGVSSGSV